MKIRYTSLICFLVCNALAKAQAPVINLITEKSFSIEQNGKFEALLNLTAAYTNPYDYDDIRVSATFTAPDGAQTTVDGFYMDDYQIANENTGALSPQQSNGFRVRFSPRQTGNWSYTVSCTNSLGTTTSSVRLFQCVPINSNNTKNKGFVQTGSGNYLHFENGDQYIPIGENMAWQSVNPYVDYKEWVGDMADNGGNFIRLWLCHWGLGMEWKDGNSGFSGLKKYKQTSGFYLDWLFDYCAEKGVYVMFCLNHHGQVSSQVNPNWSESPYNTANGGPCQNTWDFFSNAQARALIKNRLRYTIARWGCQRSIMSWELFNEVNWTDNYEQHKPEIATWHAEMAAFLKQHDYVNRPVSTSYGTPASEDAALWNNPDMDYTQRHYYVDNPNLEAILTGGLRENLNAYDKPAHIGEFGLNAGGGDLIVADPNGIHIHNNMWGTLFGGGLGTGMTWWWDSYIEPQNLYTHFSGIAAVTDRVRLHEKNFRPASSAVSGAPGNLTLNAALGWAELGDQNIQISSNGVITPANYKLVQYLYGSVWNTQFRSPPTFSVDMPQAGQFKVQVGSQFGSNPKLAIFLDGTQALSVTPAANQTYSINVPAGNHSVKVDNTGTDWMTIAGYTFTGLGSAVSAYVLQSDNGDNAAGWVLNTDYNHVFVKANGAPVSISTAKVSVQNMKNGAYNVKWYNCQNGALAQTQAVSTSNGSLVLSVPQLAWDLAFIVESQTSATQEVADAMPFNIFPNPVSQEPFQVSFTLAEQENVDISLCDAVGSIVQKLFSGFLSAGEQTLTARLANVPAGMYWVQLASGGQKTARAIAVMQR